MLKMRLLFLLLFSGMLLGACALQQKQAAKPRSTPDLTISAPPMSLPDYDCRDLDTLTYLQQPGLLKHIQETSPEGATCLMQLVHVPQIFGESPRDFRDPKQQAHLLSLVQVMLKEGVPVQGQDKSGRTVMHYAAQGMNQVYIPALLDALKQAGVSTSTSDENKNTPLHIFLQTVPHRQLNWTLDTHTLTFLKGLIEPESLNQGNTTGQTPLILAVQTGHLDLVETLVAAGAHLDIQDEDGATALDHAVALFALENLRKDEGYQTMASLLLEAGASCTPDAKSADAC